MLDLSPPAAQADAPAPAVPADLKAMLDAAIADGDAATVERVFGYARRARPDAAAAIDAMAAAHRARVAEAQAREADRARARLARNAPLANWTGQVEFGAAATSGPSSSLALLGSVDAERKGVAWSHKLLLRGEVQDTDGSRATERVVASWQPRRALGEGRYLFGLGQYEHDPALGYANRYSGSLGAGLRFGAPDRLLVRVEGGPAVRQTDAASGSRTSIAGRGSAELTWPLSARLTFEQKVAAFYEDETANGLFGSALDARVSSKLKLRLSYDYRFENERAFLNGGSASRASLVVGL
jgi:putative salt-induced outer membrane protein